MISYAGTPQGIIDLICDVVVDRQAPWRMPRAALIIINSTTTNNNSDDNNNNHNTHNNNSNKNNVLVSLSLLS